MTYVSTTSLWVDDVVKCLSTLVLVVAACEGKYNFLSFLDVVFVDGETSSSSGPV
jgi:hypothetical protein